MNSEADFNIAKIKLGDQESFDNVFRALYPQLCIYALKYVDEIELAEEIVQDTFYKLWEKREKLDINQSIKAYLYKAVRNNALNSLKHLKVRQNYQEEQQHSISESNYVDELESTELVTRIYDTITKLPAERQKIFRMSRFDELKYKEIAEKLNISVKTVENQMGKALKFLREELSDFIPVFIIILLEKIFHL